MIGNQCGATALRVLSGYARAVRAYWERAGMPIINLDV